MSAAFDQAAALAARAHDGQTRRGGGAYIDHPLAVAGAVAERTGDEEVRCAAVLHDVVEDSDITIDDLTRAFGRRVAGLVDELTDDPDWNGLPTLERKAKQVSKFTNASNEARMIKIADQWSNVADLARGNSGDSAEWLRGYLRTSAAVVEVCRDAAPDLAARFDAAAETLQRLIEEKTNGET